MFNFFQDPSFIICLLEFIFSRDDTFKNPNKLIFAVTKLSLQPCDPLPSKSHKNKCDLLPWFLHRSSLVTYKEIQTYSIFFLFN